jgi:hypothetical protein
MNGVTFDAGALIAFESNDRRVVAVVKRAIENGVRIAIPTGVLGQVWRDGRRQARLARMLGSNAIEFEPLDDGRARAAGQLCGVTRTDDVIDASVVLCARARNQAVMTSDAADLRRLDATLPIVEV